MTQKPRARRAGHLVAAALALSLWLGASTASAAVVLQVPPSFPTALTAGQSAAPASLSIVNSSTGAEATSSVLVEAVTLVPSCGAQATATGDCAIGYTDPGVLALSSAGLGRSGTACAGLPFTITNADATQAKYVLSPTHSFELGPYLDIATQQPVANGLNSCTIDFTVTVLANPTRDADAAAPGLQTRQIAAAAGRAVDGVSGTGTGSSEATVAAAAAVPTTPATPAPATAAAPSPVAGANGTPAAAAATLTVGWVRSHRVEIASTFGRHDTARGRLLTATAAPIAGARISVMATPASVGATATPEGTATTAADGTFTWSRPADESSRTFTFAYFAYASDTTPSAAAQLGVIVPARLQLRVSPTVTRVGEAIAFRGQLAGGSVPPGGKQIALEALEVHSGHQSWLTFRVIRSNRLGAFGTIYRFHTPGPATYVFRAVSRFEAAYPFLTGYSNRVSVRETQ